MRETASNFCLSCLPSQQGLSTYAIAWLIIELLLAHESRRCKAAYIGILTYICMPGTIKLPLSVHLVSKAYRVWSGTGQWYWLVPERTLLAEVNCGVLVNWLQANWCRQQCTLNKFLPNVGVSEDVYRRPSKRRIEEMAYSRMRWTPHDVIHVSVCTSEIICHLSQMCRRELGPSCPDELYENKSCPTLVKPSHGTDRSYQPAVTDGVTSSG